MTPVRLVVREDTLRLSGTLVAGEIWIEFEAVEFPTRGWNDLVLPVIRFWVNNLVDLLSKQRDSVSVPFMDGPYAVRVNPTTAGTLVLTALEGEHEVARATTTEAELVMTVQDAAQRVLHASRAKGIWSRDAELLQTELVRLSPFLVGPDGSPS